MNGFVVERAMELLEDGGLEALTLARVAESLGYTTTAVYRYFPSKDALVAAMQRQAIREVHERFSSETLRRTESLEGPAATRSLALLMIAAEIYLALPADEPLAWSLVAVLLGDPRPLLSDEESERAAPVLESFLSAVDGLFHRAAEAEAIERGDARERTLALWAALHGALCLEKARRIVTTTPPSNAIAKPIVRALLLSWGASSARLSAAERLVSKGK
ncbi:MAG: helix-turn-helix transcriptional regulator [Polyangiaceae bacterium]|nr:helix-turn-helix transcriptional regulator [Polyangiaceae bacterium]